MVRVVLADDHIMFCELLRSRLAVDPKIEVVGIAADGASAVQMVAEAQPQVVIIDVTMPRLNGVDATREILRVSPQSKVIALTLHAETKFIHQMFRAGAKGYVLKSEPLEELVQAIRAVMRGETFLGPSISRLLVQEEALKPPRYDEIGIRRLTSREREILQLVSEGFEVGQIASRLHISAPTVHTHRQHIKTKLGVQSIADLTRCAIREGLTPL